VSLKKKKTIGKNSRPSSATVGRVRAKEKREHENTREREGARELEKREDILVTGQAEKKKTENCSKKKKRCNEEMHYPQRLIQGRKKSEKKKLTALKQKKIECPAATYVGRSSFGVECAPFYLCDHHGARCSRILHPVFK
jgi:hypothetical protein